MLLVLVKPPSTAMPTFSTASSSPLPSWPMRSARPFHDPPVSTQSLAVSDQRFMSLLLIFSIEPLKCDENLAVNISESMKRWSGLSRVAFDAGKGNEAKSDCRLGSVGFEDGPRRGFFGACVTGGVCVTSCQSVSGSRNLRKTRSWPSALCLSVRFRKSASILRRLAMSAASSLALLGFAPATA